MCEMIFDVGNRCCSVVFRHGCKDYWCGTVIVSVFNGVRISMGMEC